ncbi:MAG TPA: RIP metalloprotease RseP [Panacibacter sp.]|nr:RIP metalloprotease RseP [Panacibacter sp.]HNP44217.1 RIP metalloprotease RseP [Panacibacter sp.]
MTLLSIDWGSIGIKTLQFILSFSILVTLHELGHFVTARWFKCRVEKFYLFFNPWFSLWKKKVDETEYGLGWVPFGGYVKISGMVDESMDKEQLKLPPQPYEFRAKPAWQRLIIMIGGVVVNVLLAIVIFIGIAWAWGDEYVPVQNMKYGLYSDSLGRKIGVQDGDRIIAVAGKPIERVGTVGSEIIMSEAKEITVDRSGQKVNIPLPAGFISQLNKNHLGGFTYVRYPMVVDSVLKEAKISKSSVQKGDTLISINDKDVRYSTDLINFDGPKGKTATLKYKRGNDTLTADVMYDGKGMNNISYQSMGSVLGTIKINYSFFEAIPAGFNKCWETLGRYIQNLKLLFTSSEVKVNDSLGSILSIGNTFPGVWDWQSFWSLTGIFSIILAFMNILPIPALDGGHALFTIVEMISGRKPSDKFMEYAQMAGMILLLGLMAYALGLDFLRIFK